MKYLILLLFPILLLSQNTQYQYFFENAPYNEAICDSLYKLCKNQKNTLQKAYLGAALIIKSKHVFSIYKKWKNFQKGKKILEYAVSQNPRSSEIRWIRYCIQNSIPDVLNYNQNIEEDRIFIQRNGTDKEKDSIITIKLDK